MATFQQFKLMTTDELIAFVKAFKFTRAVTSTHVHHTWAPKHKDFNGSNHVAMMKGMKDYHVNTAKYADIAQHVTLFPDGMWGLGRDFNLTPASILGYNTGGFCIEMIGNFDKGNDVFGGVQADAMYKFCEFMVEVKGTSMMFHRDSPTAGKTCPGTGIDRATFFNNVANYTENKLIEKQKAEAATRQAAEEAARKAKEAEELRLMQEAKAKAESLKKVMNEARVLFSDMIQDKNKDGYYTMNEVHWANNYVNFLADRKIVKGKDNGDGTFRFEPDAPITRGEVAVLVAKAIESLEEKILAALK